MDMPLPKHWKLQIRQTYVEFTYVFKMLSGICDNRILVWKILE